MTDSVTRLPPKLGRRSPVSLRQRHECRDQARDLLMADVVLKAMAVAKVSPLQRLELLIQRMNHQHAAKYKEVSFKTQMERAQFLRRFFRDLKRKAGFRRLPDPLNLAHRHIQAMVAVWRREQLAPATIQTYLSFLRAFEIWVKKPGLVRRPEVYGLTPEEYVRHGVTRRDKSWSAKEVDIDGLIEQIDAADPHVGAMLRVIRAFGLRRKEAVMLRPHQAVVPFEATGLPWEKKRADEYLSILAGSKGGRQRYIPIDSPECQAAIDHAREFVRDRDGHLGKPGRTLKQSLRRFDYVMGKFGITRRQLGVTAHGLRHEALIERYETLTGLAAPVRGGEKAPVVVDREARLDVAEMAGHSRRRAAGAYLGAARSGRQEGEAGSEKVAEGGV